MLELIMKSIIPVVTVGVTIIYSLWWQSSSLTPEPWHHALQECPPVECWPDCGPEQTGSL
jgi:hypothetical protein